VNVREIVEQCLGDSPINYQMGRLRVILTATGYNKPAQERRMTSLLLAALQGTARQATDHNGFVNIHTLYTYLQNQMPQEQLPNLSGDFPKACILAHHPHFSEQLRKEAQQREEHALRHEVSKLTDKILEISRNITDPDYFKRLAEVNTHFHVQQFDQLIVETASAIDFNQERVTEFFKRDRVQIQDDFRRGASAQEQSRHFSLLQELYPTYGALLCFGLNPTKWLAGAFTRCTCWRGNDRNHGWLDAQDYRRDLITQFELSSDFLRKHLRLIRAIGRDERTEELEIPLVALQEALANALVHREYNLTSPVYVDIFDERIEISSPGIPPEPMTLEILEEEHKSHPRNPQIARIFYLYGYVEKVGSGIQRMQWSMEKADLPPAKFELGRDRIFKVVFFRPEHLLEETSTQGYEQKHLERELRLKALLSDHSSFLYDRLSCFVGRRHELEELRQRIAAIQPKGGYLTITGQAGQGKSSVIAKLVEEYEPEKIAYHFIPFNPGPDHTVGLLRNLMARLILKYDLSDLYVASESRPALRDYFPKVLREVAAKGGQEVIFIDGLDQLEEDLNGVRDLSFLPNSPPSGVVFVLGTRPNDTLRPLGLLKPRHEYKLPNLSRSDFDLLLSHRGVHLNIELADHFYQAMQMNALYLDLVAKELAQEKIISPTDIIQRVADNPENIFSLSMHRLKSHGLEWREVLKPTLGVLLAAREPLAARHVRQILMVDDDQLSEGLRRLGGLIAQDGQQRYALFHLKLCDYLRQDERQPDKEYIFATDEEQGWHECIVDWCEQASIAAIWADVANDLTKQGRREYARKHYITHLYYAHEWQKLFTVLDQGIYGKAKVRYDPSMLTYAQDLDLGRQAASWEQWTLEEGVERLSNLWRYTLLRCSLASRADKYPTTAFRVLVLMGRQEEALRLAELLTNPARKLFALLEIAKQVGEQPNREQDRIQILARANEIVFSIEGSEARAEALSKLGGALAQVQQEERAQEVWAEAESLVHTIERADLRAQALGDLSSALAQAQQWERADALIQRLESSDEQVKALSVLSEALVQAQQWEQAKEVWTEVEAIINTIDENNERSEMLLGLDEALLQAQQWEQAKEVWTEVGVRVHATEEDNEQVLLLSKQIRTLVQAQQWGQAEFQINTMEERYQALLLIELTEAMAKIGEHERLLHLVQRWWRKADTRVYAIELLPMANRLIPLNPEIVRALYEAFTWVEAFLKG